MFNKILFKIRKKIKQVFPEEKLVELSVYRSYKKWIFDYMADYLVSNLDYVGYKNECRNGKINYFINQYAFKDKTNKIDVVWFTHFENYSEDYYKSEKHFLWAAKNCDYCVSHSVKYANYLKDNGVENVKIISPGIDFNLFHPKLILSWVGRILDSTEERKGLDIVNRVKKLPWVELKISNGKIPLEKLPEFYNNTDYVLITSRDEAGPMCLLEGLACGKKVICPQGIGQVDEIIKKDHNAHKSILTYNIGVYDELLNILKRAYNKKSYRNKLVRDYSWRNYCKSHDILFKKLLEN